MNSINTIFNLNSNKDARCINNIYTFLCINIINKNFIITEKEISIIFTYLNNFDNFEEESKYLWERSSIQKEIFYATIFFFNTAKILDHSNFQKKFFLFLKNSKFSNLIVDTLTKNLDILFHIYLNSLYVLLTEKFYSFSDKYFEFYFISNPDNNFTQSSFFLNDSFSFRFILDGAIKYKSATRFTIKSCNILKKA
ncbi:MAG: hypothetical protein ACRC6K_00300 [Fusobacteriaceae bacterium]